MRYNFIGAGRKPRVFTNVVGKATIVPQGTPFCIVCPKKPVEGKPFYGIETIHSGETGLPPQ